MRIMASVIAIAAACGAAGAGWSADNGATSAKLQALTAKIKAADAAGSQPPTLADDAPEIRDAFSLQSLQAAPPDLGVVLDMCQYAVAPVQAYLTYGGRRAGVQADPAQLAGTNEIRFQDEVALGLRFGVACAAREAPLMQAFVAKMAPGDWTDTRRAGLRQLRGGLVQMFRGAVSVAMDPLRPQNRDLILSQIAADAPALVQLMPLADRQTASAIVASALANPGLDPVARSRLADIKAALASTDCTAVCAN